MDSIEFLWRKRYNIPETDDRFLNMSIEDMLTDLIAHDLHDNPKQGEEFEDEDFDPDDVARQIAALQTEPLPNDFEDL